jgi:UDP-N-acetylglucosamine 3-dehydrogenase
VIAVFDPVSERAGALANAFGISRICKSTRDLCQIDELDAVDVVSPEDAHLDAVVAALHSGKAVFVEKPLATQLEHCSEMIRAAQDSKQILMVGQILRFETKYVLLKQELESGRLGKVVSMHARRNRPSALLNRYDRTHPVLENSIHDIDLMLWYTGDRVQRVRGLGRRATGRKHHDVFWGVLEFAAGSLGVVETIWLVPQKAGILLDDEFQIIGDRGIGNVSLYPGAISFWREDGFEIPDAGYDPRLRGTAGGALRDELLYFCECVRTGRQPEVVTAREAKNAVRVSLALIESANQQREIEIADWD